MGKPVVVGTDGSQESFRAAEWAAREAVLRGTGLRIVSVPGYPPREVPGWVTSGVLARLAHQAAEQALTTAAEMAAEVSPGLAIETGLLAGPPAHALSGVAPDASLLVVGSRGAGGFAALLLGSVSRYVATHAQCPVVVAREESMAVHGEIVVGVSGPGQPAAALSFAFEEAVLRKARLLVMHAVPAPPAAVRALGAFTGAERAVAGQRIRLAGMAAELEAMLASWKEKYPQVETAIDVTDAHPGHVLAGESARADLVVLGRHAAGGPRGRGPGSVTHAVLSHAHGSVVSVPGES